MFPAWSRDSQREREPPVLIRDWVSPQSWSKYHCKENSETVNICSELTWLVTQHLVTAKASSHIRTKPVAVRNQTSVFQSIANHYMTEL